MAEPALVCRRAEFELDPPLQNARGHWQRRCSLIVQLRDAAGHTGRGEAAPLPGYSRDTLEDSERALGALGSAELQRLLALSSPAELLRALTALLPVELPAARFALETALFDRLGQRQGRPLWALLRELLPAPGRPQAVAPCVLLSNTEAAAALTEARGYFELGVRCFKLKIGPQRLQAAQQELLSGLRQAFGEHVELRLDANQTLERSELAATFAALASYRPEFVEEPLAEPEPGELAELPCGWALDESLQRLDRARVIRLSSLPSCRALVLKPTTLGGFGGCAGLAALARESGKHVVVTHTLEGPLGWLACVHVAVALGPGAAAGLWPLAARTPAPLSLVAGCLPVPRQPGLGGPA